MPGPPSFEFFQPLRECAGARQPAARLAVGRRGDVVAKEGVFDVSLPAWS